MKNVFVILFLLLLVYGITIFAEPVRQQILQLFHMPHAKVLGTSSVNVSERMKSDMQKQVETMQNAGLQMRVVDVLNTLSRAQKIVRDTQAVGSYIQEQVTNVTSHK
jgi:hypothetical protein